MDYKLAYLSIGILIILIFFKNNKTYLEKRMNLHSEEGFKSKNNNNNNNNNKKNNNNNNDNNNTKKQLLEKEDQITQLREDIVRLNRMNKNMKNTIINLKDEVSKPNTYGDDKILQYNKALEDYISEVKKNKASIDLLNIGKDIEDGIFELSDNYNKTKEKVLDIFDGKFNEGFENSKAPQIKQSNKKTKSSKLENLKNLKNNVIVDTLKKELFNNSEESNNSTSKSELDEDMIAYFKHIFDKLYEIFKKYFNLYINKNNTFNLGNISKENNTLIGGGILFLVISMGLYFIDISS